jgi:CubicO group peptidase (beta-lactamase class C family)
MRRFNYCRAVVCCILLNVALACVALCATTVWAQQAKPLSKKLVAAVDEAIDAEMQRQQLVGVAVGIINHGEVVLTKGYGFADGENQVPVTTQTVFNWASNCKPLTAVAAMQLVQKKKLDLDVDIRKYVPEFSPNGPAITVRQLLCHQSGLPHWNNGRVVSAPDLDAEALASIDPCLSIRRFSETPLLFEPGARESYSSYGYILLSAVIERAGGESFFTQVEKRIAQPLGMDSLQLDVPTANQPNWSVGYTRTKAHIRVGVAGQGFPPQTPGGQQAQTPVGRAPEYAHAWKAGAGGFKSNIKDFAKWAAALINGRLASKDIEKQMWTRQKTSAGNVTDCGLGFFVGGEAGSQTIFHSGEQAEVATHMLLFPKSKDGIVILCNCGYAKPAEMSKAVVAALNDQ